jgi:hypothetical protein
MKRLTKDEARKKINKIRKEIIKILNDRKTLDYEPTEDILKYLLEMIK